MGEIDGKTRVSEASGNTVFDASQYDFFGKHVMEEVELGGLEDDSDDFGLVDDDDKDYQSFYNKSSEEGEGIDLPDIDDISSTFSKLNRTVSEPQSTLKAGSSDSFSKQSFHNADWVQQSSFSNFRDQSVLNTENVFNTRHWPSQPNLFPLDPKPINRTTSYPHQPPPTQQQLIGSKPVHVPKPPLSSYLFPLPPNQSQFSPPNQSQFSPPIHIPHNLQQFQHENIPQQFGPSGLPINIRQQIHPYFQNHPNPVLHNSGPNTRFNQMRPHLYHPRPPNQMMGLRPFHRPLFRSKYMSSDEIDNIIRIQHVATHSSDPYTDDYYHQACLAKKFLLSNSRSVHHFCPNSITESSTRTKANSEPHAFLQVEALGRLPFSSIRRPRPLLELDPKPDTHNEKTIKPLEQETMLAARIAIEDGLSLLLDIDDVDRFLQFNPPQDGGVHLRQKRQNLLEGLATSLQLVDPLSHTITQKDDLVFLRIVSLPKGRKFISRYIKLLRPNDDVARIVCMAVFRHLRFLFGETPSDSSAAKATTDLMASVTSVVSKMVELNAVSACLAAVVCSSEQPPLRPIGNSVGGDCASVAMKALLDRATELLTDQRAGMVNYVVRNMWQESFNAFFGMLTKYCVAKFESLTRAAQAVGGEIAQAVTREMPVELLRATLPHTDEAQRRFLLEFAQRSMPVMNNHASNGNRHANSESVRS